MIQNIFFCSCILLKISSIIFQLQCKTEYILSDCDSMPSLRLIDIQSILKRFTDRSWSSQIVENDLMMSVSCCTISEISYAVNSNLNLCLKCGSILVMWLVLGSVSSDLITAVSLSNADNSLNIIKQKSLALLKFCNLISATNIAVTVVMFDKSSHSLFASVLFI